MEKMLPDCQITIKGLPETSAYSVADAISHVVSHIALGDYAIDFRRLRRIVVTTDFAGELAELSGSTASKNPITFTDEEYATATAKLVTLPCEGDFEMLLVTSAHQAALLVSDGNDSVNSEECMTALHLFHHEFCHVHDENKKLDALPGIMLRHSYSGKDMFVGPLAERCWCEYIANFMSSSSVNKNWLARMTGSFDDAILRTKQVIDAEIRSYRYHSDLNHLISTFGRHGEFLMIAAAYVLGYMDGLGMPLSVLSPQANERLAGSYFEDTWHALHQALRAMRRVYPEEWKDLSVYSDLSQTIEDYYAAMGLILSTTDDGLAYVNVPFRRSTTC